MTLDQHQAAAERIWRRLITGEIEDEELSRIFVGSVLDPIPDSFPAMLPPGHNGSLDG